MSIEPYVPCKDGNCNVSAEFNAGGGTTSRFKNDLGKISKDESLMRKVALEERLGKEIEERRCPDALSRYTLGNIEEDKVDSMSLETIEKKGIEVIYDLQSIPNVKKIPKIIVVLESPHVDEYEVKPCKKDDGRKCSCRDYVRPAPARGLTGRNIKHYLPRIFDCDEFKTYKIALINPIQYQCSLGGSDKALKNEIFYNLLGMSHYESCFVERLEGVYNPRADMLINCCTRGKNQELVWDKIRLALCVIRRKEMKFPLLKMNHPSSWHLNCRNRNVQIINQIDDRLVARKGSFCEKDYVDLCGLLSNRMGLS